MAQILYRAKDDRGHQTAGMIEAGGVAQARELLLARGLRDVELQQEAAFGVDVNAIAASSGADVQRVAEVAVRFIERPGVATLLTEVWRGSKLPTLGFAAFAVFALWKGTPLWAAGALAVALLPYALALWSFRRVRDYEQFLRAQALGHWTEMPALADRLRALPQTNDTLRFDLDLRCAYARIKQGAPLEAELAALETQHWRERLAAQPGAYDAQVALLHVAAGRPQGLIDGMRAAVRASGGEPARALDLALTLARCGDVDEAASVMDGVDASLLPPFAKGFVAWVRGRIGMRKGDPAALALLGEAVQEMLALAPRHPALWISLALCTADHARLLRDAGRGEEARAALGSVWPILRVHAPPEVLDELKDLLPATGAAPTS
jgi:hypothetical protein